MPATRRGFLKCALAAIGAAIAGKPMVEGYLKGEREWYLPPKPPNEEYFLKGAYAEAAAQSLGDEDRPAPSLCNGWPDSPYFWVPDSASQEMPPKLSYSECLYCKSRFADPLRTTCRNCGALLIVGQ